METIKISDTKLKVILSKEELPKAYPSGADTDALSPETREALRGFLKKAGSLHGVDVSSGRLFIQLYRNKDGGCELFVTRLDGKTDVITDEILSKEEIPMMSRGAVKTDSAEKNNRLSRYAVGIYEFSELDSLLHACDRLSATDIAGQSAVYADEEPSRFYLVICESGTRSELPTDVLLDEYGGKRRKSSVYAYIKEHCDVICGADAVKRLGALA